MKNQTETSSKMQFVQTLLTNRKNRMTKAAIAELYSKKFKVAIQTAKNTVAWMSSVGLKRLGKKSWHLAN